MCFGAPSSIPSASVNRSISGIAIGGSLDSSGGSRSRSRGFGGEKKCKKVSAPSSMFASVGAAISSAIGFSANQYAKFRKCL